MIIVLDSLTSMFEEVQTHMAFSKVFVGILLI